MWRQGWQQLRPVQVAAVGPILDADRDVVVTAATAAGKTEAAFLPICSALLARPSVGPGVEVLYVSPLKALINDQYGRLEGICADLDISVHRWHGDVAGSAKTKLRRAPSGILLITPESLEALFVLQGNNVAVLLAALRYVVVDELHAFIGTERGAQLQSLLHRVDLTLRRPAPRVALSATLGDLALAAAFLRPGAPGNAALVRADSGGQELRLRLFGYRITAPRLSPAQARAADDAGAEVSAAGVTRGDKVAIAEHLFGALLGTDNLVFANTRRDVEIYSDLLATLAREAGVENEFFPHHGSLSKDLRGWVESRGSRAPTQPLTAICTSTLEMGIDIGDVASVAQIGAPNSVISLRQRLGRSGRRGGAAVLRNYIAEREVTNKTPPPDSLRAELVQSIAMLRLMLTGWIEPLSSTDLHLSTLVQQLLSLIAQHGGVIPSDAYRALCGHGPFQRVTVPMFAELLRNLGGRDLIWQEESGLLLLGSRGERIVEHHTFYAAFTTPEEYRLVAGGRQLGSIPVDAPLVPGSLMIFAGRRWRVVSIDDRHKVIDLARSSAARPPAFSGEGGEVHDRVRAEMRALYLGDDVPPFLDAVARELLAEARDNFRRLRLDRTSVMAAGADTVLFPWAGDRRMRTLAVLFAAGGLKVANDGIALTITDRTPEELAGELAVLVPGGPPDPVELAALVPNKAVEKYDRYLGDNLLAVGYAARRLDPVGAWAVLDRIVDDLSRPTDEG